MQYRRIQRPKRYLEDPIQGIGELVLRIFFAGGDQMASPRSFVRESLTDAR